MASSSFSSLQLPTFTPLEPLTIGTNLPPVSECDLDPITPDTAEPSRAPSLASSRAKPDFENPPSKVARTSGSTTANGTPSPTTSQRSGNGRPVSRNFLSRMSYHSVADIDKASMFSSTPSTLVAEGRKKPKRTSWWKKIRHNSSKRQSVMLPQPEVLPKDVDEQYHPAYRAQYNAPPAPVPVQSGPPPPRLPDDLFGKNLSTLDGDEMFKDLK